MQKISLDLFFSAKTHKEGCPLRVIISERGSWQKLVASFLLESLRLLKISDPFLIKNADDVIEFLKPLPSMSLAAFSIDVKDLFYSIPHKDLLHCVEDAIDDYGAVSFSGKLGIPWRVFWIFLHCTLSQPFLPGLVMCFCNVRASV